MRDELASGIDADFAAHGGVAGTSSSRAGSGLGLEQLEPRVLLAFDPTGIEQELFQLVNRFRSDPQGELSRLVNKLSPASSLDPYINEQLAYWKVDGSVLASQFKSLASVPPLAWSEALYDAAHDHNLAMLANDGQQHQFPGEPDPGTRMTNSGYAGSGGARTSMPTLDRRSRRTVDS